VTPDLLFVYGSLRPAGGHPMGRWLHTHARLLGPARTRGRLYDLGAYPGLIPAPDADREAAWVHGEVFRLPDPERLLPRLDAYEGCGPQDHPPYLFERHPQPVVLADGARVTAWVYRYNRPVAGAPLIPSGDWLDRR